MRCSNCGGSGKTYSQHISRGGGWQTPIRMTCSLCKGSGEATKRQIREEHQAELNRLNRELELERKKNRVQAPVVQLVKAAEVKKAIDKPQPITRWSLLEID